MSANPVSLSARLRRGERDAEEEFERSFGPLIYRIALRALRDRETARDVTQEVFLATIRAVRQGTVQNESNLGGFIYGTAKNIIQARSRKEQRERRRIVANGGGDLPAVPVPDTESDDRVQRLATLLQALEPIDRAILHDTILEGLASEEVAARYGMSAAAVRKRKSRAIAFLRGRFEVVSRDGRSGDCKG